MVRLSSLPTPPCLALPPPPPLSLFTDFVSFLLPPVVPSRPGAGVAANRNPICGPFAPGRLSLTSEVLVPSTSGTVLIGGDGLLNCVAGEMCRTSPLPSSLHLVPAETDLRLRLTPHRHPSDRNPDLQRQDRQGPDRRPMRGMRHGGHRRHACCVRASHGQHGPGKDHEGHDRLLVVVRCVLGPSLRALSYISSLFLFWAS